MKYNVPLLKKYGIRKFYFSNISSADFKHIQQAETPWLDKQNSSVALPDEAFFKTLPYNYQQALLPWSEQGYAILENFYTEQETDQINSEVERLLTEGKLKWKHVNKLMNSVKMSEKVAATANNPLIGRILDMLLGRTTSLFQSINFYKGSQQAAHSDIVHMTTFPQGYLIAVWIALEDIDEEQGPLFYYPGSHRLPYFLNSDYDHGGSRYFLGNKVYPQYEAAIAQHIAQNKLEKKTFKAKKGDLLIWHANLLHGGSPILNKTLSRKSMVLHYYAEGVICYHEISQRPALID